MEAPACSTVKCAVAPGCVCDGSQWFCVVVRAVAVGAVVSRKLVWLNVREA